MYFSYFHMQNHDMLGFNSQIGFKIYRLNHFRDIVQKILFFALKENMRILKKSMIISLKYRGLSIICIFGFICCLMVEKRLVLVYT